ncbi:MAG: TetR family transcriptional regulator, partial [Firmicutes bacterium]|nr:TetR family transcriptional regulator [Bacillota bacterium]
MKTMEINDKTYFLKNNKDLFIATLSEFAHKSFEVASLNDIIKTSGLNKGSFYYRFNDKLDLYYALMDYLYIEQLNIFEKQTQYLKGNFSLEVLLHAFFTNSYNLYSLNPELLMLNYNSFLEKEDLKNNRLEHCISSLVDKVLPVIENLILKDYKMKSTILKMFIKNVEIQYYFLPFVFKDTFTSSDVSSLVSTLIQSINLYRNLDNLDQSVFLNNKMSLQLSKENKDMFDLNLKLTKGEILAIVGPNKSPELILQKLILELFDINDGEIEY